MAINKYMLINNGKSDKVRFLSEQQIFSFSFGLVGKFNWTQIEDGNENSLERITIVYLE